MSFEVTGKIEDILDFQQITDNFGKREFVLEIIDGQYSQYIKFQTVNDRCSLLDALSIGQEVAVHFNLQGRPYKKDDQTPTVYFNSLTAWKVLPISDNVESADTPPSSSESSDDDFYI